MIKSKKCAWKHIKFGEKLHSKKKGTKMKLFDFFKKKTFSSEEVEKEYQNEQRKLQSRRPSSLERAIEEYAENTYVPRKGEDLLKQKADFIRSYTYIARKNRYYYSLKHKKGKLKEVPLWTQKWHDYEQKEHLRAQHKWHEMMSHTR